MSAYTISYMKEIKSGNEVELLVEFEYFPGTPPRFGGLPEHCSEGENEEINITSVRIPLLDDRWLNVELDDELECEICEWLSRNTRKFL